MSDHILCYRHAAPQEQRGLSTMVKREAISFSLQSIANAPIIDLKPPPIEEKNER